MNYFLNIGSNLGNRRLNISRAAQRIMGRYGWMELSHIVESQPWGYESDNAFMNIGVRLVSDLEPVQMLAGLQEIERELGGGAHRDAEGRYVARVVGHRGRGRDADRHPGTEGAASAFGRARIFPEADGGISPDMETSRHRIDLRRDAC